MIKEYYMNFQTIFDEIFNSKPRPIDNIAISEFPLNSIKNNGLNEFKQFCIDKGYEIDISYPEDGLVQVKVLLK